MEINYKVSPSARPMWLLRAMAEFREMVELFDTPQDIARKLSDCLDRQSYTLGGGGAEYPCSFIRRETLQDGKLLRVWSVTGIRILCEIKI